MIAFVFRWLLPALGLAMLGIALAGAPGRGSPPLATLWHERVEARVTRAAIVDSETPPHHPVTAVFVAWPPGSATEAPVGALSIGHIMAHRRILEMEVERYPPGTVLTVRVAGGRPWADVTDGFALAWTIGLAALGAALAAMGAFLNRALR